LCLHPDSRGEGAVGGIVPRELTSPVQVHSLLLQNELIHKIVAGNHSYMVLTESGRVLVNGYVFMQVNQRKPKTNMLLSTLHFNIFRSNAGNQLFKTGTTALISQLVEVKCSCIVRDIASRSNSFAMLQGKYFSLIQCIFQVHNRAKAYCSTMQVENYALHPNSSLGQSTLVAIQSILLIFTLVQQHLLL